MIPTLLRYAVAPSLLYADFGTSTTYSFEGVKIKSLLALFSWAGTITLHWQILVLRKVSVL